MPDASTAAAGPIVASTPNTNTSPMLSEYDERGSLIDRLEASATSPSASANGPTAAVDIETRFHDAQAPAAAPAQVMASQAARARGG